MGRRSLRVWRKGRRERSRIAAGLFSSILLPPQYGRLALIESA